MNEPEKNKEEINELKKCKCCFQKIHPSAKVCQYCGRAQNFWLRHFWNISIVVPVAMVFLAGVQLFLAYKQNVDASKALETAETAAGRATTALTSVENARSEANIALDEVRAISDFGLLLIKALNDDRASFFELSRIGRTAEEEYHEIAQQAITQIIGNLRMDRFFQGDIDWEKELWQAQDYSLADFAEVFNQELFVSKPVVIRTVWEQERFSKAAKLEILYEVITENPSLENLALACMLMEEEAKLGKDFLAYSQYAKWWEENRENYNKKPEVQPTDSPDKK